MAGKKPAPKKPPIEMWKLTQKRITGKQRPAKRHRRDMRIAAAGGPRKPVRGSFGRLSRAEAEVRTRQVRALEKKQAALEKKHDLEQRMASQRAGVERARFLREVERREALERQHGEELKKLRYERDVTGDVARARAEEAKKARYDRDVTAGVAREREKKVNDLTKQIEDLLKSKREISDDRAELIRQRDGLMKQREKNLEKHRGELSAMEGRLLYTWVQGVMKDSRLAEMQHRFGELDVKYNYQRRAHMYDRALLWEREELMRAREMRRYEIEVTATRAAALRMVSREDLWMRNYSSPPLYERGLVSEPFSIAFTWHGLNIPRAGLPMYETPHFTVRPEERSFPDGRYFGAEDWVRTSAAMGVFGYSPESPLPREIVDGHARVERYMQEKYNWERKEPEPEPKPEPKPGAVGEWENRDVPYYTDPNTGNIFSRAWKEYLNLMVHQGEPTYKALTIENAAAEEEAAASGKEPVPEDFGITPADLEAYELAEQYHGRKPLY